jgi:hypothetical protein
LWKLHILGQSLFGQPSDFPLNAISSMICRVFRYSSALCIVNAESNMQEDNAPCRPVYLQKPRRGSEGISDGNPAVENGAVEGVRRIPDAAVPDGLAGVGAQGRLAPNCSCSEYPAIFMVRNLWIALSHALPGFCRHRLAVSGATPAHFSGAAVNGRPLGLRVDL